MSNMKEMMEFPVIYTFKAMGVNSDEFINDVRNVFKEKEIDSFAKRPSSNGSYISVSITTEITSFDELQNTYKAIKKINGLKFHL